MNEMVWFTIVFVLSSSALFSLASDTGERLLGAAMGFVFALNLAGLIWVVYVAQHFVSKYW